MSEFDELGSYRYVLSVPGDDARDPAQQRLGLWSSTTVVGARSCSTRSRGTWITAGTSSGRRERLFIHPNTLRQRLDRIQRESGIDLEHEDWLSLAVATKVVKLARMRSSIQEL